MWINSSGIDNGKSFDWGRTSGDYAKYRDIYPEIFYEKILSRGMCLKGQKVLDLGTGTGVLPRNMYRYGADWTGADISAEQIAQAEKLSEGMNIKYFVSPAEKVSFPDGTFDVITVCQCIWYFDHEKTAPLFRKMLKDGGRMLILYMAWLPFEDKVAGESENLVLKYNPDWTGAGETMHPIWIPEIYERYFDIVDHEEFRVNIHFTADGWNGRMRACRGVGAALPQEKINEWENEHLKLLSEIAPDGADILHYCAMTELKAK